MSASSHYMSHHLMQQWDLGWQLLIKYVMVVGPPLLPKIAEFLHLSHDLRQTWFFSSQNIFPIFAFENWNICYKKWHAPTPLILRKKLKFLHTEKIIPSKLFSNKFSKNKTNCIITLARTWTTHHLTWTSSCAKSWRSMVAWTASWSL